MSDETERLQLSDQEAFDRLLALLHPDRERAGDEYVLLRMKLCDFFAVRYCRYPEEWADETLKRLTRKLATEPKIEHVAKYAFGIARRVIHEGWRKESREAETSDTLPDYVAGFQDSLDAQLINDCLTDCLSRLAKQDAQLFVAYYCVEDQSLIQARKDLAEHENLTPLALRIRIHRMREKLSPCMEECLRQGPKNMKRLVH